MTEATPTTPGPLGRMELAVGLYERLIDRDLDAALTAAPHLIPVRERIDPADLPHILARHLGRQISDALQQLPADQRREFANRLLRVVPDDTGGAQLPPEAQLLTQVLEEDAQPLRRPATPLSDVALLTNAPADPSLHAELRTEMLSSDRVDLLCAFIKRSGTRLLRDGFEDLRRRGVPLRVLTTTYIGATDRRALDELVREYGAQVKISYNARSTRLHAKAWLFHRGTGFHTGYVGSSNLSRDALLDGLEWNVRISQTATPALMEKFSATFDTYWKDPAFEDYDPDRDGDRLDAELMRASGRGRADGVSPRLSGLEVRPYDFQRTMLEELRSERTVHGRHRNLLVAATGTGKTVMAALDYRELSGEARPRPTLLFLAHRREILEQALSTYRDVLGEGAFGELMVDGHQPVFGEHVFASVQSMGRPEQLRRWNPDHFDIVVVDEFHHAEAATYRRILDHLTPRELLGLTATPERTDGVNVAQEHFGGRIASQMRLWDALERDLLVPFHYFGIWDDVDLSRLSFRRGEYETRQLASVLDHHDARARKVINAVRDQVTDPRRMRALGFCVSVEHARFMAQCFRRAGLPAVALSGASSTSERDDGLAALRAGEITCIFAVDLFNEGLDIPEIDTVLMLRPTQSATIFLQQLGRGLRRAPGKSVLTVLDFVGHQSAQFRFDLKLRALTGLSRSRLVAGIEQGFPFLPSGSQIILDRVAQQEVLANVRSQLSLSTRELVADIRQHTDQTGAESSLRAYLEGSGRTLADIYGASSRSMRGEQRPACWSALEVWAWPDDALPPLSAEYDLLRRIRGLTHVDDPERIRAYRRLLDPALDPRVRAEDSFAPMLYFSFWPQGAPEGMTEALQRLARSVHVRRELLQLLDVCETETRALPERLNGPLESSPLRSHARYSRDELAAALGLGTRTKGTPGSLVSGVRWFPEARVDLLLVTLRKSEAQFSPSTLYRDYAVDESLFHWESQSSTAAGSPTGLRYRTHEQRGSQVLLCVREATAGDIGTEPFTCLGTVRYREHQGEKPMRILWELDRPMPPELLAHARAVA